MDNSKCLNCGESISKKFCPNCGQKTNTHRITPKHFFLHDIFHGVWHLDKGILFTLKEAIIRPGQAALDYINGKRIRYYNVFYLCLLLMGLNIFINQLLPHTENTTYQSTPAEDFIEKHAKIFVFMFVPIFAIIGKMVYHKLKINIAEHFIIAGIILVRIILINIFVDLFDFFNRFDVSIGILIFVLISIAMVYYDFSKTFYPKIKALLMSFAVPLLTLLFTIAVTYASGIIMKYF